MSRNPLIYPAIVIVVLVVTSVACSLTSTTPTVSVETIIAETVAAMASPMKPTSNVLQPTATVTVATAEATVTGTTTTEVTPNQPSSTATLATLPSPTLVGPTPGTNASPTMVPTSIKATRINFATGATDARVDGKVNKNSSKQYVLKALAGQTMMVQLSSADIQLSFMVISSSDGAILGTSSSTVSSWNGTLPTTQDYLIKVTSGSNDATFNLDITIPVRVKFKSGATSEKIDGHIQTKGVLTYLAYANGGQTMTVKITSPKSDVYITVYGMQDGSPLVRWMTGQTEWTGKLPATQDYVIQAVSTGAETDITVEVTIK